MDLGLGLGWDLWEQPDYFRDLDFESDDDDEEEEMVNIRRPYRLLRRIEMDDWTEYEFRYRFRL